MQPKETKTIQIDQLELDPDNPRLPVAVGRSQDEMRKHLAEETGMQELMASIGANGFFDGEALIVCETPDTKAKGVYRVVEGNRRLAALQLLSTPSLVPRNTIRQIAEKAVHHPTTVPVVVFTERADILVYLGFRHITGVKNWDSLAKARYMAQLFEQKTEKTASPTERYRVVARMIGSRHNYVRKLLISHLLYQEIEKKNFYDIEELLEYDFPLSLLTTAVSYANIERFIELVGEPVDSGSEQLVFNPDTFKELVEWLFKKDKTGKAKVPESRNLQKLSAVVVDNKALKAFREGANLEQAYRDTHGAVAEFMDHLRTAEGHLESAMSIVATVVDKLEDDHSEVVEKITKQANGLQTIMKTKKNINDNA